MDLVCLIDNKEAALHASDLVAMIGDLLERGQLQSPNRPCHTKPTEAEIDIVHGSETNFEVKPLPKARIPIIKLTLQPSPGLPYGTPFPTISRLGSSLTLLHFANVGIACDIGFENRLALENTRLLLTYATIDPARIRTLVLFRTCQGHSLDITKGARKLICTALSLAVKVWSKRRKINSPYKGTLSSYGYTLMVIFYLVHVKNPPVLPNLQRIAPLRPMTKVSQLVFPGKCHSGTE